MSTVLTPEIILPNAVLNLPVNSAGNQLTGKQRLFCQAWVKTRNGVQSAIEAGYNGDDQTLRSVASENLTKPNIRAYIDELFSELHIGHAETLAELGQMARCDLDLNPQGPIRASDKLKALELVGKHLQLWDRNDAEADAQQLAGHLFTLLTDMAEQARQRRLQAATPDDSTP